MELLAGLPGRRVLIMGGMAELGPAAAQLHHAAGAAAKRLGIDALLTLGPLAAEAARGFGAGAEHFDDLAALAAAARPMLDRNTVVLVKGSRSSRMERVVDALAGREPGEAH